MNKSVLFIHGAGEGAYAADQLLAASLQTALGPAYQVRYPRMVNEGDAEYDDWKSQITSELAALDGKVIAVGHSVGGSVLIKYFSEQPIEKPISGLFLLATPFWNGEGIWKWEEVRLPEDLAARLANIPQIFLYHSRDDETVPFAHLALYAAKLPHATIRELDGRGHQFANDLTEVAEDIKTFLTHE
jgi:uncharacterized protein